MREMIVNPFRDKELVTPYTGTRILPQDFQLLGVSFVDPHNSDRVWTIRGVYGQVKGRSNRGIRVKVSDQKGFVSFVEQMELEVLLGMMRPGERSRWSGQLHHEPGEPTFFGPCMDEDDLIDDLFDREQLLRGEFPDFIPTNTEIIRRVHLERGMDYEELYYLHWDGDVETGISPDIRIETLESRWKRVERRREPWEWAQ